MKKLLAFLIAAHACITGFSQTDSCAIRISLLTCSQGNELYSAWGHSGIRVTDSSKAVDLVYNYGTFDFDAPGFYSKFGKGNMQYYLSTSSFDDFIAEYQYFKRGIIEQTLNLTCTEKQHLINALTKNATTENRYYRYDFLFDNCSSRIRDIISKNTAVAPTFKNVLPKNNMSFWNLIHEFLDKTHKPWNRFIIDILLGSKMDATASSYQAMFLPDYLMASFDSATIGEKKLVSSKKTILTPANNLNNNDGATPFICFGILFAIIAIVSFIKPIAHSLFFSIFDFTLFLATGLMGILLLLLWFGRVDTICSNNYNMLWALPTHAIMAFLLTKKQSWFKTYWLVTAVILVLLIIAWKWLPQEMNNGLLPFVLLLLLRSIMQYRKQ